MKKLVSRLHISDITPPSRFLLLEKFVGSSFFVFSSSFYLFQFLSNFFKYLFSNFPSFHPYNIFAIYFPGSSALLKSFFSTKSNFFYFLTSIFILPSNSTTNSFVFSKFFSFSQVSYFVVNPFYLTKYLSTPLIFLLFRIFSTFYSSTSSTLIGFTSFFFYPFTCFLYYTTLLTFITR